MKLKGECEHCGAELRMETEKEVSQHLINMMERVMGKVKVKVLCGNCGKMTHFKKGGD